MSDSGRVIGAETDEAIRQHNARLASARKARIDAVPNLTGAAIYAWLKRWGFSGASLCDEQGIGRVLAPCSDRSQWVVIGCLLIAICGCDVSPLFPPVPRPPIVDPVTPITDAAWVLVLEESSDRTPEMAALLADPWWHSSGVKFRVYDKDSADAADVVKAVGNTPLPALLIVDPKGKRLHVGKLPASIDGIKALIGGKR